ncbi:cyclic di-GMP phosphodiesterase [Erwinia psidii]|uniref:Cyclic di-GMP phosphodiesterase n=1 Tax=Erwinia psidii TaxID=69224 RepID=A0A3N6SEI1_9GAMM|nr:cyclic di-GMP phosphodiesterase [Erwinia psidii]MCX8956531.1 cyclic di-GMP phosphodiesterase [Erwinia psidii]MCX8966777.1 cyclic di-GMP phosphodiesterase [Erwinia psidii]RQM39860.1 cyclic di-GMP phosphodiesterase [Erwinia psidii]
MPFSITSRQDNTNTCKIACYSVAIALFAFLLFITSALVFVSQHHSEDRSKLSSSPPYDVNGTPKKPGNAYLSNSSQNLTERAALNISNRTFMQVNNALFFCSSSSGNMPVNLARLSADTGPNEVINMCLPTLMPNKSDLAIWLKDPHIPHSIELAPLNINLPLYLLLATHQQALATMLPANMDIALNSWEQHIHNLTAVSGNSSGMLVMPGLPLTLLLYGKPILVDDITMVLLAGMLFALLSGFVFYMLVSRRMRPGRDILEGIRRGNFHVVYQPVIATMSGKISCIEALLRWTHPEKGSIPPDRFISYAESTNLIAPLTRHLFELVARDSHILRRILPVGTGFNLNISPNHLADNCFCDDVAAWLEAMPQDHFNYVFEITERTILDEHSTQPVFNWIRNQGISIAVDDFGTGHSALIYLDKFNFDYLKIDRGFIENINSKTLHSPVLEAVLTMVSKLGMLVVAEGVENSEQASWLIRRGVSHLQGYLFSRPCTVPQLMEYMQQNQPKLFLS